MATYYLVPIDVGDADIASAITEAPTIRELIQKAITLEQGPESADVYRVEKDGDQDGVLVPDSLLVDPESPDWWLPITQIPEHFDPVTGEGDLVD